MPSFIPRMSGVPGKSRAKKSVKRGEKTLTHPDPLWQKPSPVGDQASSTLYHYSGVAQW